MTGEDLSNHIKNIFIKKPEMRGDVNFFIAHVFKHDLKSGGLDYEKITGKDLLNEMVNKRLSSVDEIIEVLEKLKDEYKNDISENVASKRENAKVSKPVGMKEYDMVDTHGNRLYSKGATVYLKLAKGEHRKLGVIDPKQRVFAVKRERMKHLFRKFNAYGFNHHFFSTPSAAFDRILLEDDFGKYLIPVKMILEGSYLHFLGNGFERQVFLPLERIELLKQDSGVESVEGAEDESVK